MRVGMGLSRDQEIDYAIERGIDIPVTHASPYSVDVNLWGRSIETGILEDPWVEPPADVYAWTVDPADAPPPAEITLAFRGGIPVSIDGAEIGPVELVEQLNAIGGAHGVGRIDHVEDRLVGIKSREIYEAPAAVIVHAAHHALEGLVLAKDQLRFNRVVAGEVAQATYDGLWFSALQADLRDYAVGAQRLVSGEVRIRLDRGNAVIVGRRSPNSLYDRALATYDAGDAFDHESAVGFINIFGLPLRTEAKRGAAGLTPGAAGPAQQKILPTLDVDVSEATRVPEVVAG
jgi:argininosuccinate synthase